MALTAIYMLTLLGSTILGFIFWNCLKSNNIHLLVMLLLISFLNEAYCFYVVHEYNASTGGNYNIVSIIETSFFSWFYASLPILKKYRPWISVVTFVYLTTTAGVFIFLSPLHRFNTHLFLFAALLLVFWGLFFLYEYFRLDDPVIEKKLIPLVWITAGVVMFFSITSITFSLYNSLVSYKVTILGFKPHQLIPQLMSIFRYGCFATAFYLCRNKI